MPVIDDTQFDVGITSKICNFCINFSNGIDRICIAFPNGIPMVIWKGENNHKKPYRGDDGVMFEKREE